MRDTIRLRLVAAAVLALCAAPAHAQTAPTTVTGTAIGVSSITWNWSGGSAVGGGYRVLTSTGGNVSGDLPPTTSSFTWTEISTNTATQATVEAFILATTADASPVTVHSLAAQPSGTLLLYTNGNTSSLSWLSNGNPTGTIYNVDWFVGASTPIVLSTQPVVNVVTSSVAATVVALPGGQSIDFNVQAVNGDGIATPFDVIVATAIASIANQAAISSGTYSPTTTSIIWYWAASTGAINYQLFEDSGVAASPLLGPNVFSSTQTGLTPNTLYQDYIEAFGATSSTTTAPFGRYTLAAPTTGLKLQGLSTATASETLSWNANGNPPNTIYQVEWWTALTSTVTVSTQATSAVISGLSGGASVYFTIQAKNGDGILSAFDATLTGSPVVYSTAFPVALTNLGPGFTGNVTYVLPNAVVVLSLSSGTFASAVNVTVSTVASSGASTQLQPPFPSTPNSPSLTGGQSAPAGPIAFQILALDTVSNTPQIPLLPVIVSVYYPPAGSGLAPVDPNTAAIARADFVHNLWVPLATSRNSSDQSLHAVSTTLGLFQILGVASGPSDLSQMTVGPNPLRPMVNPGQLMTFRNLPLGARVRIFTYVGEKLADVAADGSGVAAWDGRNAAGSWVASGVYLAVIQGGGAHKTMRVAIER